MRWTGNNFGQVKCHVTNAIHEQFQWRQHIWHQQHRATIFFFVCFRSVFHLAWYFKCHIKYDQLNKLSILEMCLCLCMTIWNNVSLSLLLSSLWNFQSKWITIIVALIFFFYLFVEWNLRGHWTHATQIECVCVHVHNSMAIRLRLAYGLFGCPHLIN